jgi:hypothetical protein
MSKRSESKQSPILSESALPGSLRVDCRPLDDRSLLEAVKQADIVFYLASKFDVDHPVLQPFRKLVTRLNPWAGMPATDDAEAQGKLAAEARTIFLQLGLKIHAGNTTTIYRGQPRRVLAIFFTLPQTQSVTVTLESDAADPRRLH